MRAAMIDSCWRCDGVKELRGYNAARIHPPLEVLRQCLAAIIRYHVVVHVARCISTSIDAY